MAIEPGTRLSHYEIRALLGAGGMGEVYLATDLNLHRQVAIKVIRGELIANEDRVRRFEREALTASSLNHPNILTIFEINREADYEFIVTEYVEGDSLSQHIRQGGFQLYGLLDIGMQVASALGAAHAAGVVHRDIKPENIMLRRDGLIKVVDFGLAKLSEQQTANLETNFYTTAPGLVIGTLPYMSPEQARGLPLDGRTDIWSLGVVLYELAGGILPFAGNTMSDVIAAILMRDPPPLSKHASGAPLELERIVNKALTKDLGERYQLAEDLGKDLRTLKHRSELDEERKASGDQVDSDRRVTTELTHERKRSYDTRAVETGRGSAEGRRDPPSIIAYLWRKPRRRSAWLLLALIPLLAVAGWWLFTLLGLLGRQRSNDESTRSVEIVPFTSFPGDERLPSFSPDGSRVAFTWNGEQDNTDIYIKQVGTEALQRLTTDVAPDTQPRWSPNGLYIAFLRQKAEAYELYLIPSIGGAERKLTELALVEPIRFDVIQIGWSPDSKWLAVSDRSSPDEPYGIFMVGRESGEKTRLTQGPDYSPAVSPDGKNIAYRHFEVGGVSEIYVKPVAGGQPKRLTFSDDVKSSPAWTPDGREILFLSETGGSVATVWRIPATGGTSARVDGAGLGVTSFAISPKGDRLALAQTISDSNIWQVELQGSGLPTGRTQSAKMLISSTRADTSPQFSPDGRRIVFASTRSGSAGIWISDSDGRNPVLLAQFDRGRSGSPRWSPDGRRIVFDGRVEGNVDIYVINAEGGQPRRLTTEPSEEFVPSFSRDGRWIYFCSNRSSPVQIWKMPAEGGGAVQVTKGGGFDNVESPDGQYLYYAKDRGKPGIWRVPVAGGEERLVLDKHRAGLWRQWEVTKQGIFFATAETPAHALIEFFSFATSKVSPVMSLEKGLPDTTSALAVSPDGRLLIWTQQDQISSDITLMNGFH